MTRTRDGVVSGSRRAHDASMAEQFVRAERQSCRLGRRIVVCVRCARPESECDSSSDDDDDDEDDGDDDGYGDALSCGSRSAVGDDDDDDVDGSGSADVRGAAAARRRCRRRRQRLGGRAPRGSRDEHTRQLVDEINFTAATGRQYVATPTRRRANARDARAKSNAVVTTSDATEDRRRSRSSPIRRHVNARDARAK